MAARAVEEGRHTGSDVTAAAASDAENARAPGDSGEQREAERVITGELARRRAIQLEARTFPLPKGGRLEVDGYCDSPPVLCEAWAHQGHPKSAQKGKVTADAFKLLYLRRLLSDQARLILAFGDQEAAAHFQAGSWVAQALQAWGIEVHVVSLAEDMRGRIRDAQRRQRR